MEKLIELLNEYRTEKGEKNLNEFEVSQTLDSLNYLRLFIKRLVDNDKIDRDRCECRQLYNALKRSENDHGDKNFSKCERIIMLLSIQDNPIEFLCDILEDDDEGFCRDEHSYDEIRGE